jgi:hypothetical protein
MNKKEEIYKILEQWNINQDQIVIDNEAEDMLLIALKNNPTAVYLDEEAALIIEQD